MSRRRCCCGECYEFLDEFSRADSTDVGSDWEECSGDWQIWNGHLRGCGSDATITLLHMVGDQVGHLETSIHIRQQNVPPGPTDFSSVGAKYRILIFWGTEESPCTTVNPWIAELEISTATTGVLRLFEPGGSLWMWSPCNFTTLFTNLDVCVSNEEIMVLCSDAQFNIYGCPEPMNGFYFALQSGTGTCTYWDQVKYIDHFDHDPRCPDCITTCCCPCIESKRDLVTLTATIFAPGCYHMHGVSTVLDGSAALPECAIWASDDPLTFQCPSDPASCEPYTDYELQLSLRCTSEDCDGYQLTVFWPPGPPSADNYAFCYDADWGTLGGGIVGKVVFSEPGCTCYPVSLMFGPFRLWKNPSALLECCKCCEEFYIVITETP